MTLHRYERAEAAAELDAAFDWYAERRAGIAGQFLNAVEAAIAQILDWPDSGHPYPGREAHVPLVRTRRIKGFPYRVVYLVDGANLVIVAYPHDRQRPGYWLQRVQRQLKQSTPVGSTTSQWG